MKTPPSILWRPILLLFPDMEVTPHLFLYLDERTLGTMNAYVGEVSQNTDSPHCISPTRTKTLMSLKRIREGGFIGVKSYLNLAPATYPVRNPHLRLLPGRSLRGSTR